MKNPAPPRAKAAPVRRKAKRTIAAKPKAKATEPALPHSTDWRTTDEDEVRKRQVRAREESFGIVNVTPEHPVFSNFQVRSGSGLSYSVEIRDLRTRQFSCSCADFRINGLDTCKHVEAVLLHLQNSKRAAHKAAAKTASPRIDLLPDTEAPAGRLRIERAVDDLPEALREFFTPDGRQNPDVDPATVVRCFQEFAGTGQLRVSQDVAPWLEAARAADERVLLRRDYEAGVQEGRHPAQVTLHPLFPYQREGMLHLAFGERALLADEMGLGKTIQAIAACALLHHLGKARRVLVVTPASLKAEWEEQIERFTRLPLRLIYGGRAARAKLYADPEPPFFTIANYEQIIQDSLDINAALRPDIVVLDEAQRIKNWPTKTARAIKRLESRYAFVLTGTPLENRIDELYSLVDYLDPTVLGPLFRFNREYYVLDDRGRPSGYQNLEKLRERVKPLILRRRKADVETELPDRTDQNLFVPLTGKMRDEYASVEQQVAELVSKSKRRPLTPKEQDLLMILMNQMRMICDTPSIMKGNECRDCPKLDELGRVLEGCLADPEVKVIIFSEWEGMLRRVRELAEKMGVDWAWHTGSVPQKKRRAEIREFRDNPACRLFLSTDSGGVGLNLQNASVVINCDLPWNPAKLEQRIARAWRKNQRRAVTVVNLIAERTIEHGMLGSLANKMMLAAGVLDGVGDLAKVTPPGRGDSLLKRLEQLMAVSTQAAAPQIIKMPRPPSDPGRHFAMAARQAAGEHLVRCEEIWLKDRDTPVIIAVLAGDPEPRRKELNTLYRDTAWGSSKPDLQFMSTEAWDSMAQLAELGIITIHTRARRDLLPGPDSGPGSEAETGPPPLSEEQLRALQEARVLLEKKLRAATLLLQADLVEEAEPSLRDALLAKCRITAIEQRLNPPAALSELLDPPYKSFLPEEIWDTFLQLERELPLPLTDDARELLAWLGR